MAILFSMILDYGRLGAKRHRQWCKHKRDWSHYTTRRGKNREIYTHLEDREVFKNYREKTQYLFSRQFGLMCDELNLDVDEIRGFFIRLMTGFYVDTE